MRCNTVPWGSIKRLVDDGWVTLDLGMYEAFGKVSVWKLGDRGRANLWL